MIVFAAAAAGGCSSDTGRFGNDPIYTGSTPNQRAILGQSQPQPTHAQSGYGQPGHGQPGGWRNVETTGSIAPSAPPVTRQDLAPPTHSYAVQPPPAAPLPQAPRVAAANGWTATGGSWISAQHGDTVDTLSRRYGVPSAAIAQANGLSGGEALQPGQRVLMPVYSASQPAAAPVAPAPAQVAQAPAAPTSVRQIPMTRPTTAAAPPPVPPKAPAPSPVPMPPSKSAAAPPQEQGGVKLVGDYTVRKGDTLASIARTYGVSETALKERNNLKSTSVQPGQHLLLPAGTKLILKTSQAPTQTPASAPVKEVAQAPVTPVKTASIKPTAPVAVSATAPAAPSVAMKPATPSSTAKIDQKAAETIAVAKEPAVEEPSSAAAPGSFRWPVRGRIISEYGSKANGEKNEGINMAVPEGTSVKAADDGEVIYSGNELKGYGNLVLVRHGNGYVTAYAHASELLVNRGDKISRGQIIARAGATGSVSQPQLHFELRKGQKAIDPKPYLASN
ncbi:MAG: LysM peptidoglycan-binding domain-containing M23 family metallopeptidase [Siculibacillus sp.]|nr:LysM peptidoglycan-binding domain-containing M23 family metallopeptidase [Siculibacillus sp.]